MTDGFYGNWCFVSGAGEIVHLPEAMDLLVAYYRQLAGEHPTGTTTAPPCSASSACMLRISVEYAGPNVSG